MNYNDFATDLQFSLDSRDDKSLNELYHKAFPHLKKIIIVDDLKMQKRGIDKILIMASGKEILVDEKKRRKDYGDILLEEYSNFEKKEWGWLNRSKYTDYIVYVIVPSKKVYFLPFLLLQKAWLKNYPDWLKAYGQEFAKNQFYTTSNIPIPTTVLLESIKTEMCYED